ncbi:MAG TPA: DUF4350 domain-containing protein [Gemmatimonadaceae bacterium]
MTAPRPGERRAPRWYFRPKVILPAVMLLIIAMAAAVRQREIGRSGDPRLSTYSTSPMGARIFYETIQKFGWTAVRWESPDLPPDSTAVFAVLDPPLSLRATEVHALLQRVRAGGALFVMLGDGATLLGDSLHMRVGDGRFRVERARAESEGCPATKGTFLNGRFLTTLWPGDRVTLSSIVSRGPRPDSTTLFIDLDPQSAAERDHLRHSAAGFPYGRGRIVVGSDPDVLRNDAIRNCTYGLDVAAMQMLGYLGNSRSHRIIFDEYHQGYGSQPGTMNAIGSYLVGVASGRTLLQLLAAGLVLLIAAAPRLIPPQDAERVERRSPLEHVDALGRAYAQVGATRSATARLLRGVRRRVAGGAVRPEAGTTDDVFLDRARRDAPGLAADITLIQKALHSSVSRQEFAAVGAALEHLELSLTRI